MYIWIHVKYSSTSREKLFWYDKIIFQIMCVTVVQINRVLLPATLFSVSLCRFFSCLVSFFNTIFRFGLFLLHSYCWPCWSCTWINIYSKLIKSGVLFWKRDFKTSWSAYWPSLRPEKIISCQDMSVLWKSWIFFNVIWHHDKQHTVHHKLCSLTPNTHQWPTGES